MSGPGPLHQGADTFSLSIGAGALILTDPGCSIVTIPQIQVGCRPGPIFPIWVIQIVLTGFGAGLQVPMFLLRSIQMIV